MPSELYQSQVVCRVCGITPRTLDYWITSGVIEPFSQYEPRHRRRVFFLFTLRDMVKIKAVQSLRASGVSLQRIRDALKVLKARGGAKEWEQEWLLTDGRNVYRATDKDGIAESLSKRERGQLVFSIIAFGELRSVVETGVRQSRFKPFDPAHYQKHWGGVVRRYARQ